MNEREFVSKRRTDVMGGLCLREREGRNGGTKGKRKEQWKEG